MSGVSPRLRCLFFSFNVVFVVGGGLLVLTAVSGLSPSEDTLHGGGHEDTTVHMVLYVYGSVTMAISILGAFGAHRLNLTALVVCLLCTVTTGLLTLRDGITAATARPQLQRRMELSWRLLLPLDGASDDRKQRVETLQTSVRTTSGFCHIWSRSLEQEGDGDVKSCLLSRRRRGSESSSQDKHSYTFFKCHSFVFLFSFFFFSCAFSCGAVACLDMRTGRTTSPTRVSAAAGRTSVRRSTTETSCRTSSGRRSGFTSSPASLSSSATLKPTQT
ncbi:uncharacterized protein LOC124999868 isoform X1 [Mugil cephalus]|uniref:uncharacterized protein LOC124999868 isoform X1 n=1 Tax=Mugil cephalus TaxID=48193 RepID=UPI001FB7AA17|nr:uncharacterized protein LOC124999868 isoform X1 [Mugil cephalus]